MSGRFDSRCGLRDKSILQHSSLMLLWSIKKVMRKLVIAYDVALRMPGCKHEKIGMERNSAYMYQQKPMSACRTAFQCNDE